MATNRRQKRGCVDFARIWLIVRWVEIPYGWLRAWRAFHGAMIVVCDTAKISRKVRMGATRSTSHDNHSSCFVFASCCTVAEQTGAVRSY